MLRFQCSVTYEGGEGNIYDIKTRDFPILHFGEFCRLF